VSPVPRAWSVNFIAGATLSDEVTNARRVRCVNEPAPRCYSPPYQALAGGLVYDRATGLTWQQTIDANTYTWSSALAYCTSLGSGWRTPSLTELQTIEDHTILGQGLDGIDLPPDAGHTVWIALTTGRTLSQFGRPSARSSRQRWNGDTWR
jgi:hypothetical protein